MARMTLTGPIMLATFGANCRWKDGFDLTYSHADGTKDRAHFAPSEYFAMLDWFRERNLSDADARRLLNRAVWLWGTSYLTDSFDGKAPKLSGRF